jgi:Outer membrane efflux protein
MSVLRVEKPHFGILLWTVLWLTVILVFSANASVVFGQDQSNDAGRDMPPQEEHTHQAVTALKDLLNEAERNNPQIAATRQGWEAAKQIPSQVSTLPDPQFTAQQVNVGSPRPFAGYTNSDFAYFGLGVSQDFPYPGKLRNETRTLCFSSTNPYAGPSLLESKRHTSSFLIYPRH